MNRTLIVILFLWKNLHAFKGRAFWLIYLALFLKWLPSLVEAIAIRHSFHCSLQIYNLQKSTQFSSQQYWSVKSFVLLCSSPTLPVEVSLSISFWQVRISCFWWVSLLSKYDENLWSGAMEGGRAWYQVREVIKKDHYIKASWVTSDW